MNTLYILTLNGDTRLGDYVIQDMFATEDDAVDEAETHDAICALLAQIQLDDFGVVTDIKTKLLYAYGEKLENEEKWEATDFADLDIFEEQSFKEGTIFWAKKGERLQPGVDQRKPVVFYRASVRPWRMRRFQSWLVSQSTCRHKSWWGAFLEGVGMSFTERGAKIQIEREIVREKI